MFSGGILRAVVIIDAIDKASGRLNMVKKSLTGIMKPTAMDIFSATGAKGLTTYTNNLIKIASLKGQINKTPLGMLAKGETENLKAQNKEIKTYYSGIKGLSKVATSAQRSALQSFWSPPKMSLDTSAKDFKQMAEINERMTGIFSKKQAPKNLWKQYQEELGKIGIDPSVKKKLESSFGQVFQDTFKLSKEQMSALTKGIPKQDELIARHFGQYEKIAKQQAKSLIEQQKLESTQQRLNEATGTWEKRISGAKQQLSGILVLLTVASSQIQMALESTKELMEAQVLIGKQLSVNAYTMTQYGASVDQIGRTYKALARSPFKDQVTDISKLNLYMKMFRQTPEQLVPIVSGFASMGGGVRSFNDALDTMFLAASKGFADFGGWYSMVMQGFVPGAQELNMSLNETVGLMASMSQLGISPFGMAFGLQDIMGKIIAPTEKVQEELDLMGVNLKKITKEKGLVEAFSVLKEAMDKMPEGDKTAALRDMFGGFSRGVALGIMNNIDLIKEMQTEMGNTFEVARQTLGYQMMGYYQLSQVQSQANALLTQFITTIMNSRVVVDFLSGITFALQGISNLIAWIDKIPVLREFLGGAVVAGVIAIVFHIKRLTTEILNSMMALKGLSTQLAGVNAQINGLAVSEERLAIANRQLNYSQFGPVGMFKKGANKIGNIGVGGATIGSILSRVGGMILPIIGWVSLAYMAISWIKGYFENKHKAEMEAIVKKWADISELSGKLFSGQVTDAMKPIVTQEIINFIDELYNKGLQQHGALIPNNFKHGTNSMTFNFYGDYTEKDARKLVNAFTTEVEKHMPDLFSTYQI